MTYVQRQHREERNMAVAQRAEHVSLRRAPVRRNKAKANRRPATSNVINLRADAPTRSLIDWAANALGLNRTEFMLTSARVRAQEVFLSQTHFTLSDANWTAFQAALEAPPVPTAELIRLMASTPPWSD
jgi:uncharacterized protein (DUF1778 family)